MSVEKKIRYIAPLLANLFGKMMLMVFFIFITLEMQKMSLLGAWESVAYDKLMRSRALNFTHPKVVAVEIGDKDIREVGTWPWKDIFFSQAIAALRSFGAKAVVFQSSLGTPEDPEGELLLKAAMEEAGNVYLPLTPRNNNRLPAGGLVPASSNLRSAAKGEGHVQILFDSDGRVRRTRPFLNYGNREVPGLAFRVAMDLYGVKEKDVLQSPGKMEWKDRRDKTQTIPLTPEGDFLLNWAGPWDSTFLHVSFVDVLKSYQERLRGQASSVPLDIFKDAVCLVGVTAPGFYDSVPMALQENYPTLGVTATVLNSVLSDKFLKVLPQNIQIVILCLLGIALMIVLMIRSSVLRSLAAIGLACLTVAGSWCLFTFGSYVNFFIYPLFLIASVMSVVMVYDQLITDLSSRRLGSMATKDLKTGLVNRGHFKLMLAAEIRSAHLDRGKKLSMVMIDIDRFKKINDTYGHDQGDRVLTMIAEIIKTNTRSLDIACRYGGEEFIVLLPGSSIENAVMIAEKMRLAIESQKCSLGEGNAVETVTASFGVTDYAEFEKPNSFIERSDKALYRAKCNGRNRVVAIKGAYG